MPNATTDVSRAPRPRGLRPTAGLVPTLVFAWSRYEPERIGQVAPLVGVGDLFLGRGKGRRGQRVVYYEQHPGQSILTGSLLDVDDKISVSRDQVRFFRRSDAMFVKNVGRLPMLINNIEQTEAQIFPGDVIEILDQYVFLYIVREPEIAKTRAWPYQPHPFGDPDAHKLTGGSPLMWKTRDLLARVAKSTSNVILFGESGVGKELAAKAIHIMSSRGHGPFLAINMASLSPGLIEVELFGNRAGLTDGRMLASVGLAFKAQGGTLFLDEIGDMAQLLQHHLLRALEKHVRVVGENVTQTIDTRYIAATNSPPSAVLSDILARLRLVVHLPCLNDLREDIPTLIRERTLFLASQSPELYAPFLRPSRNKRTAIAIEPEFVTALLRHDFVTNVRELEHLIEQSAAESTEDVLTIPTEMLSEVPAPSEQEILKAQGLAALAKHDGDLTNAAKSLGVTRATLGRRIGRYPRRPGETPGDTVT
jgi:transcriptional regulator with AAA-type ATPase domain